MIKGDHTYGTQWDILRERAGYDLYSTEVAPREIRKQQIAESLQAWYEDRWTKTDCIATTFSGRKSVLYQNL